MATHDREIVEKCKKSALYRNGYLQKTTRKEVIKSMKQLEYLLVASRCLQKCILEISVYQQQLTW